MLVAGLAALAATAQDPRADFAKAALDAAAQQRTDDLAALVAREPDRAVFLVRDALRGASRTRNRGLAKLAGVVATAVADEPTRMRLLGDVDAWLARDSDAQDAAHGFELAMERAQTFLASGDGIAAAAAADDAIARATGLDDPYLVARARSLRGVARALSHDLGPAIADLGAAMRAEEFLGAALECAGDRLELARHLEERAGLASMRGDYQSGLRDLLAASELWAKAGDTVEHGRCLVQLGGAFSELARFADAEDSLRRALACFSEPNAARGRAASALALTLLDEGQPEAAVPLLHEARRLAHAGGDPTGEAIALRYLGRLDAGAGRFQAAADEFEQALAVPVPHPDPLERALAWIGRGAALGAIGDGARSRACYEEAAAACPEVAEVRWRVALGLGRLAERRGEAAQALALDRAAVADLEYLRGLIGVPDLRARALAERREPYFRAARLAARAGDEGEEFALLERLHARALWESCGVGPGPSGDADKTVRAIEAELRDVERRLAGAAATDRAELLAVRERLVGERSRALLQGRLEDRGRSILVGRAPETLAAVQACLRPDEALVVFAVGSDGSLAQTVRRDRAASLELDTGAEKCEELVERLLAPARDLAAGRVDTATLRFDVEAARELYELWIEPLHLDGVRRVWLVPDGSLHRLPFAMLVSRHELRPVDPAVPYAQYHGCRFLIEDHELAYLPVASLLTLVRSARGGAAGPALVVATGSDLPGAESEGRAVVGAISGMSVLLGAGEAREAACVAALREAPIAHFAVHAELEPMRPGDSALRLEAGDGSDGLLHAYEIERLDLPGSMIVLSGCDTAGRAGAGEGLLGLTRAFLAAGARAVIATHWPVEDAASADLMADFHRHLATEADAVRALREAQLAMLAVGRRDGTRVAHPFFWAGYGVHGRP